MNNQISNQSEALAEALDGVLLNWETQQACIYIWQNSRYLCVPQSEVVLLTSTNVPL